MLPLRLLLSLMLAVIDAYTSVVIARYGLDLLAVFFGDMTKMGWAGQFYLDFMGMLIRSRSFL